MRISIQFTPEKRIDFEFGYNTPLFSGMHWFCIVLCDLGEHGEVEYATLWLTWFKHPVYWFNYWGGRTRPKLRILADPEDSIDDLSECPECGLYNGDHAIGCCSDKNELNEDDYRESHLGEEITG